MMTSAPASPSENLMMDDVKKRDNKHVEMHTAQLRRYPDDDDDGLPKRCPDSQVHPSRSAVDILKDGAAFVSPSRGEASRAPDSLNPCRVQGPPGQRCVGGGAGFDDMGALCQHVCALTR